MKMPDDKILALLSGFIVFFAVGVLVIAFLRPDDGQTFTVFTSALAGFIGALLGWVKAPNGKQGPPAGPG
jgi:hypothetical protein